MDICVVGQRALSLIPGLRSCEVVRVRSYVNLNPDEAKNADLHHIPEFHCDFEKALECDAIAIGTPMHFHASQSILALSHGKHVISEVTAAVTIEECERLVIAARESKGSYTFAENYGYFRHHQQVLELVRQGRFGDLYYAFGEYNHEVRFLFQDDGGVPTWRAEWQVGRLGNTYCTHSLGPIMQWFRAQDPSVRIESVVCFGTGPRSEPRFVGDDTSLTIVRLSDGGLIHLRLDLCSNRPHGYYYGLQGTLGAYEDFGKPRVYLGKNETVRWTDPQRSWSDLSCELPSELDRELAEGEKSGHWGADYMVGRRWGQSLTGEREIEIGIRDGIEWTMVGLLSQKSRMEDGAVQMMPSWVYSEQEDL